MENNFFSLFFSKNTLLEKNNLFNIYQSKFSLEKNKFNLKKKKINVFNNIKFKFFNNKNNYINNYFTDFVKSISIFFFYVGFYNDSKDRLNLLNFNEKFFFLKKKLKKQNINTIFLLFKYLNNDFLINLFIIKFFKKNFIKFYKFDYKNYLSSYFYSLLSNNFFIEDFIGVNINSIKPKNIKNINLLNLSKIDSKKKPLVFNNLYPIFGDVFFKNSKNINKLYNDSSIDYLNFYKLFLSNFFESFFKNFIFFKIENNFFRKYKYKEFLKGNIKNHQSVNIQLSKYFVVSEMIEVLWYSFEFKDLNLLNDWLLKMFKLVDFKNHKKFISIFQEMVKIHSVFYKTLLGVNGFFFFARGKLSASGNAKKKKTNFNFGNASISDFKKKNVVKKNVVKTNQGLVGFTMILSY